MHENAQRTDPEIELVNDIAHFTHDPLGYVLYAFPWGSGPLASHDGPDDWQRDILSAIGAGLLTIEQAIRIAVASGHDIGKSALVSWIILWGMSTHEDTRGVVTANTESQLRTKTWPELTKWHRLAINSHWFTVTATAIFSTDKAHEKTWRMDAIPWSETNTEAFAGLHNEGHRVIILFDEASAIHDAIWEVTEGATLDASTEIIWAAFGNPTRNRGRFKECFGRFRHRWLTKQIDSRNCRISNKKQIEEWIEDYGIDSDFVKVRVRGMFPAMSSKQFISLDDIDKAYGRSIRPEKYEFAPKILACDPAWEGDDELVIGLRQGLLFEILRVIAKNDNDFEIATILANLEDEHEVDAVFVDAGYGTGIVSAGKVLKREWRLVWFGGKSSDIGCLNKRAEMYKNIRDWLKEGGSIPEDPRLRDELIAIETIPRLDSKIQLADKKDVKRELGYSPGRADCIALSFAYPVNKKAKTTGKQKNLHVAEEWSPFEN